MLPTIKIGETVTVDRYAYRARQPALGDIVLFHPPSGAKNFLGTCGVADEGESPSGHYFSRACDVPTPSEWKSETFIERVVGLPGDRIAMKNGHVYRNGVREKDPYIAPCGGYPQGCNFPQPVVIPRGDYYMIGDNRCCSEDSRFWGPVRKSWIVGRVVRR
jgi:signal peptidase I